MKTIGVIGAMPEEVTLLRDKLSDLETENVAGLTVYSGMLYGKRVVLCQSGMGKVNAAAATQLLITKYSIDAIINSGIAGNMTSKVGIGDVVLSKEVMYHDAQLDMIKQSYPFLEKSTGGENLITAALKACSECDVKAITGRIATGDLFIGDTALKQKIADFCSPDCVEMEGAAIAHVAAKNDIPFIIIRAMSDNADEAGHELLVVKKFDMSVYCDTAATICEKTIRYAEI